jgi:hypothetical protein
MNQHTELARRSAIARILADRGDMLVVTGLGSPTYDCAAVGDHPLNFYLWGATLDLAGVALACGFRWSATVRQMRELDDAVPTLHTAKGPILVVLKVSATRDPLVLPPWDGALLKSRFRQALLGAQVA